MAQGPTQLMAWAYKWCQVQWNQWENAVNTQLKLQPDLTEKEIVEIWIKGYTFTKQA